VNILSNILAGIHNIFPDEVRVFFSCGVEH